MMPESQYALHIPFGAGKGKGREPVAVGGWGGNCDRVSRPGQWFGCPAGIQPKGPDHVQGKAERDEQAPLAGALLLKSIPASGNSLPLQPSGDTEIGWHFHPNYWGHGFATEPAAAALTHAFESDWARWWRGQSPGQRGVPEGLPAHRHGPPWPNGQVLQRGVRALRRASTPPSLTTPMPSTTGGQVDDGGQHRRRPRHLISPPGRSRATAAATRCAGVQVPAQFRQPGLHGVHASGPLLPPPPWFW